MNLWQQKLQLSAIVPFLAQSQIQTTLHMSHKTHIMCLHAWCNQHFTVGLTVTVTILAKFHTLLSRQQYCIICWFSQSQTQQNLKYCFMQHGVVPVTMLDIFQTGVTSMKRWRWFTETGQIITIKYNLSDTDTAIRYYCYYYGSTSEHPTGN